MTTQTTQPTTDQITVRVTLDGYDFARPAEKQTQVYVQIPEVARVSYLLPAARFHGLKDRAWPEVLDVAQEHYAQGWVIDPSSAVARQAVMEWLRDSTNRDEMQVAYEEDQARQNPVLRNLRSRITELEADREANDREYEQATARIAELENERHTTNESLSDAAEQLRVDRDRIADLAVEREKLIRWHGEDSKTITTLVARVDRYRAELTALRNDALSMRGSLSPNGGDRKVPFELGETLAPAVDWLIARVAELETAQGTVYRAAHDTIPMGMYRTAVEARKHCEASARASILGDVSLDWDEDEDGVSELVVTRINGSEYSSGYVVTPLEVAAEYNEEADQ